jgi:hypothetical protein
VSATRLAATLVHESQHYRLTTLHDVRRLCSTPSPRLFYSPWRNDPRTILGIIHGIMAFTGVADFWSRERTDPASELEYARHVRQLRVAHRTAARAAELTPLGAALVDALGDSINALSLEAGPEDIRRIADDLVTGHRANWRFRNVMPDENTVRATVRAWQHGHPVPDRLIKHVGEPRPTGPSGDDPLTGLAMAWLDNEIEVRTLATEEELFTERFPGTVTDDLNLLAGDYPAARTRALTRIAEGAADDHTWTTLVVAHGRICAAPEQSPLVCAPELVRAAFPHVSRGNDLGPLLTLLSRYPAGTSMSNSRRR